MSDFEMRWEMTKIISQANMPRTSKMVCPVVKLLSLRHKEVDKKRARQIAKEILE